jgi:hypothetical protein
VAEFATPEWIESLSATAAAVRTDPDLRLTVEQRITGPQPTAWHFSFADGRLEVGTGTIDDATISLSSPHAIAAAIHAGELSAQRAFLDGDLRIGGDLNGLIVHRAALAEAAALMAAAT